VGDEERAGDRSGDGCGGEDDAAAEIRATLAVIRGVPEAALKKTTIRLIALSAVGEVWIDEQEDRP
jgi:hypothetical protein